VTPDRVGFSTTTMLLSRIIRWFTNSAVSHAWILYFDESFGCDCVFEFDIGGGQVHTYESFQKKNKIVHVWTPKHPIEAGFAKAAPLLDCGYDYLGLLGMIWVQLGAWLKRKWHNPWVSPSRDFCSEGVVRVCQWSGYPGMEDWDPTITTPEKLLEFAHREEAQACLAPPS